MLLKRLNIYPFYKIDAISYSAAGLFTNIFALIKLFSKSNVYIYENNGEKY